MRMTESLFIFFRKLGSLFCSEGETLRKEGSAGSGAAFMNSDGNKHYLRDELCHASRLFKL